MATSGRDFLTLQSRCALDCARRGLNQCDLTETECLCTSRTWFAVFSPCTIDTCPKVELQGTVEDIQDICNAYIDENPRNQYILKYRTQAEIAIRLYYATVTQTLRTKTATTTTSRTISTASFSTTSFSTATRLQTTAEPSSSTTATTYLPSETNAGTSKSSDNGGLDTGAKIGLGVGIPTGVILLGIFVIMLTYLYRKQKETPAEHVPKVPAPYLHQTHEMPGFNGQNQQFNANSLNAGNVPPVAAGPVDTPVAANVTTHHYFGGRDSIISNVTTASSAPPPLGQPTNIYGVPPQELPADGIPNIPEIEDTSAIAVRNSSMAPKGYVPYRR